MRLSKIVAATLFTLIASPAFARHLYNEVCDNCRPYSGNDQQVRAILQSYGEIAHRGDIVQIQRMQPNPGPTPDNPNADPQGSFPYANWTYDGRNFGITETGYNLSAAVPAPGVPYVTAGNSGSPGGGGGDGSGGGGGSPGGMGADAMHCALVTVSVGPGNSSHEVVCWYS